MERQKRTEKEGPLEIEGEVGDRDEAVRETGWDPQLVTRAGQGASSQAGFRAKSLLLSTQLPSVSPSQAEMKLRAIFHRPPSYRYYHVLEYIMSSHCRLC